ncbi:hypothetical protein BC831DRAFT_403213 [Entophlyctis helioformis]|nr:hypothetical protein BC831DRAFT_403213 [Entophlyctis helioformis]
MPAFPIPKPSTEPPRPQRRHYHDQHLSDLESKIITSDLRARTSDSTYTTDFADHPHATSGKAQRRVRRKYDDYLAPLTDLERLNHQIEKYPAAALPTQRDADHLLYLSTYQAAYTTQSKNRVGEFHYMDDRQKQLERQAASPVRVTSLYHDSFSTQPKVNRSALGKLSKAHVMTKSLYQDMIPGLTVKDLFTRDVSGGGAGDKVKGTTSYDYDFRDFEDFVGRETVLPKMGKFVSPVQPQAVKYRRWAQM